MYFITICAVNRAMIFGKLDGTVLQPSQLGEIVQQFWLAIPLHSQTIQLDQYIVMPNHIHGLLQILPSPTYQKQLGPTVSTVINQYKAAVTLHASQLHRKPGEAVWQRGFYEHVVRDERDLYRIREYITTNPLRWELDRENPQRCGADEFDIWLEQVFATRASPQ